MSGKVYAQVYSMIRTFPEGLIDALNYFSEVGYDGVELVGANTDGLDADDFKKLLEELHLKVAAIHSIGGVEDMNFAGKLGVRYITTDCHPVTKTREEIQEICDSLNRMGAEYRAAGLKLVLHNHADEFDFLSDSDEKVRIYEYLLKHTDPELLGFELDAGWAALAGVDVAELIRAYPGRFVFIHVKECDRLAQTPEDLEHFPKRIFNESLPKDPVTGVPILTEEQKRELYETRSWNKALGKGLIDWPAVVKAADEQGCEAYISEREYYHYDGSDGTAACCVKLDYDYMRSVMG